MVVRRPVVRLALSMHGCLRRTVCMQIDARTATILGQHDCRTKPSLLQRGISLSVFRPSNKSQNHHFARRTTAMEIPADTPDQSQESIEVPEALPEPGPYENYIRGLLPHWPHLRIVTDFMSVDLKDTPTPFAKRMFKTDVRVVDIISEQYCGTYRTTSENLTFGDLAQFQQFLEKPRENGSRNVNVRLIMVEDLSAKLIETLGSKFNIDPDFFAQHLGEWSRHYRGFCSNSPERAGSVPYPLNTNVREQGFRHFTFQRAYEWQGEEWIKKTNLANSNLWRPHISRGIKPEVFVNERFSVFASNYYGWTGE